MVDRLVIPLLSRNPPITAFSDFAGRSVKLDATVGPSPTIAPADLLAHLEKLDILVR